MGSKRMIANMMKNFWMIIYIWLIFPVTVTTAQDDATKTMLLFVGEDQDILSIASGREESAWQAPAVAMVVEQKEFRQKHYTTVTETIDTIPGFHVVETASGIHSYLRGIPESILYLYDTVPMKFADEISLHSIKRIEIVRGPGSVLWGPDAFAGIVNVVPMTGKDLNGIETGVIFSSNDARNGAYINRGWDKDGWDSFLSFSGSLSEKEAFSSDITRFWGTGTEPVPVEERRGSSAEEYGQQIEIAGNFSYNDSFKVSGRFTDSKNPYSISHQVHQVQWKEVRNEKTGFLKVEAKKQFGIDSALRFTGTTSILASKRQIIDESLDHDEYETYGELIYEKVFDSGGSHFTAGTSFRNIQYKGVSVWDAYLPDFLVDENDNFLPTFSQEDYTTGLWSIFSQYRMSLRNVDLIFGVRYDVHDSFEDNLSYNAGVVWNPSDEWICKVLLGTAYRTPSPRQLFSGIKTDLEEIRNLSIEVSRKFGQKANVSLAGFINQIDNHVMDDPYAGLSNPNSQEIRGIEVTGSIKPVNSLTLSGSFTWLKNHGPLETYLYNDFSTLLPDGSLDKHFVRLEFPYDSGPDLFYNIDLLWSPKQNIEVFAQTKYFSGYELTYPRAEEYGNSDSAWLVDAGIRIKDVVSNHSFLEIKVKNLMNTHYMIPGEYSLEQGAPISISIVWRKRW